MTPVPPAAGPEDGAIDETVGATGVGDGVGVREGVNVGVGLPVKVNVGVGPPVKLAV